MRPPRRGGPDEAGAYDAAHKIAGLLEAGAEKIELAGAELRRDPVRLGDEARSTSLFGGARYILVRSSGDEAFDAVETLLDSPVEVFEMSLQKPPISFSMVSIDRPHSS